MTQDTCTARQPAGVGFLALQAFRPGSRHPRSREGRDIVKTTGAAPSRRDLQPGRSGGRGCARRDEPATCLDSAAAACRAVGGRDRGAVRRAARGAGHDPEVRARGAQLPPAARNYMVAPLAAEVALRINELRMPDLDDVRWEPGSFGRLNGRGCARTGRPNSSATARNGISTSSAPPACAAARVSSDVLRPGSAAGQPASWEQVVHPGRPDRSELHHHADTAPRVSGRAPPDSRRSAGYCRRRSPTTRRTPRPSLRGRTGSRDGG